MTQTERLDAKIKRLQQQIDEQKRLARPVSTEDFERKRFESKPAPAAPAAPWPVLKPGGR